MSVFFTATVEGTWKSLESPGACHLWAPFQTLPRGPFAGRGPAREAQEGRGAAFGAATRDRSCRPAS